MIAELKSLFGDLNLDRLRVVKPSRFMFLCGGAIVKGLDARPLNLRDYLYRVRPLNIAYPIVLAEEAIQLYRDTEYHDLISFEEDIARIASVVLVIVESAGSFAELGAFASNDTIRKTLRIFIQKEYEAAESFIRFGPVERILKDKRDNLGVYPWRLRNGRFVTTSASPHYNEMKLFIRSQLDTTPASLAYKQSDTILFYTIYWIIFVCFAITPPTLIGYVSDILPFAHHNDIKSKIYCMRLSKWIHREAYSGKDYLYTNFDVDPFEYAFKPGVVDRDRVRRKLEITTAHRLAEKVPSHIKRLAAKAREPK